MIAIKANDFPFLEKNDSKPHLNLNISLPTKRIHLWVNLSPAKIGKITSTLFPAATTKPETRQRLETFNLVALTFKDG